MLFRWNNYLVLSAMSVGVFGPSILEAQMAPARMGAMAAQSARVQAVSEMQQARMEARAELREERREARMERREDRREAQMELREANRGGDREANANMREAAMDARRERRRERRRGVWRRLRRSAMVQRPADIPPPIRNELRRHARRIAKLARIEDLAEAAENSTAVQRVHRLRQRERQRHDRRLERLTNNVSMAVQNRRGGNAIGASAGMSNNAMSESAMAAMNAGEGDE